jgi:hypothetical protein
MMPSTKLFPTNGGGLFRDSITELFLLHVCKLFKKKNGKFKNLFALSL